MDEKPKRGGRRAGAGRPPKSGAARVQKSINLPPDVWTFIAQQQREGESESDTVERLLREHPVFNQV